MPENTEQPVATDKFTNVKTGDCFVPTVFADDLHRLLAALDWARVFARKNAPANTASELSYAARVARSIADRCEQLAVEANRQAVEGK
jgi:hypothetical protein